MIPAHAANVFWSTLEAGVSALFSFAAAFVVARLIGPAQVGIGAAAVAMHVLLWVAVNALFADALVQRTVLEQRVFSSATWFSIGVGVAAAVLQAGLGWPLAVALADDRLFAMSAILAVPLPLVGMAGPVQGLMTRHRAYRALAARTLIGQGVGTCAGIVAAMFGAGAWALVLQQTIISTAGAVTLLLRSPWWPRAVFHWDDVFSLLRIGLPLTASTLLQHGRYRLFALLVGGTAGASALGQVHMAFRLVDGTRDLAFTAQWRLMLPLLSERQHDLPGLREATDRCLVWSGLIAFPLYGLVAVCMQPLVSLALGPAWQPAAAAALPLIALTLWLFLVFPAGVAVIALGQPRYTLLANIAGTTATILCVLHWQPATPMQAISVWFVAQLFVSPYALWANAKILRIDLLRPLLPGLAPLALAACVAAGALLVPYIFGEPANGAILLAARLGIGITIWLAGLALAVLDHLPGVHLFRGLSKPLGPSGHIDLSAG